MEIKGKCHCFFEQSGTFKNEFKRLGYEALDYDIQNNFGQTDCQVDLFKAIEDSYDGEPSLFDSITEDDLIMAFFPCVYFCATSQMLFYWRHRNYRKLNVMEATEEILSRVRNREYFFSLAVKMLAVARRDGIRLIMENPWAEQTYLKSNFVIAPTMIDKDRTLRGDYFVKPTAYWFINCEPTHGNSIQKDKERKKDYCQQGRCESRTMFGRKVYDISRLRTKLHL